MMRKFLKNTLLIGLGVLLFGSVPNQVDAADFSFGSTTKSNNVTKIPVTLEIATGESFEIAKLGCEAAYTDVTCEINSKNLPGFTAASDAVGMTFSYFSATETSPVFPAGNHVIAEIVLTNANSSKISDLTVKLKGAKIGTTDISKEFKTEVGAKPVDKVKSNDSTLKSIKFSQGTLSPEFKSDVTSYTIYNIADTINSIRVTPTCNTGECDFRITGGKSTNGMTVTLNQGENTVNVEVTSEDGSNSKTYTFKIYRGETSYNSSKLSSLSFGDYTLTPAFSKDIKEYKLTVPNAVNGLVSIVNYVAEDKNATVDIKGLDNFIVGENTIKITVDNASGDETMTYTVVVTRLGNEKIEIISYINLMVTFKDASGIQTELSMDAFKEQYPEEAEKIQNGTYKFDEDGNIITDDNIEEDEEKETEEKKKSKVWIIVLLVVVGLAIIAGSGYLIFRKKKSKSPKAKKQEEKIENIEKETSQEFENENQENEELGKEFSNDIDKTVDIDEALSDLMSTKQYDFADEEKETKE